MMNQSNTAECKMNGRGFWALIATQFQGAFNDNAFKVIVVFLLPLMAKDTQYPTTAIAFLIFNLPFLMLPSYAGFLADRFSKQRVALFTKYWEVGVMLLGTVALMLHSISMLWITLFLMAMQSAFFSPAKYGILPEILKEERLPWGNGILQLGTMIAIIAGTAVGAPLVGAFEERAYLAGGVLVVFSAIGTLSAHFISKPQAAAPTRTMPLNPWAGLGRCANCFRKDRMLLLTMLGIAYFWFAGTLSMQNIIELAKETVDSTALQGQLLTALSLGIGIGSVAAGFLSRGKIRMELIPAGGFGLAVFSAVLGMGIWGFWGSVVLLFGLGFFGGFFVIPLDAMLQKRSPEDMRGDMIATCNFVTFSGMTVSAVLFYLLFNFLGFSTSHIFLLIAVASLIVGVASCFMFPICISHIIAWCIANTAYRLKVVDADNLPRKGGALLVSNHVSFVDTIILSASTDRKIRYIGDKGYCNAFLLKPMAKLMGVLPVSAGGNPEENAKSLRQATAAIEAGEVVCIFAEGQLTRTGELMPFRRGLERIMNGCDAPIVPVHMDNLWGSIFSYSGGRFFWKMPELLPRPVTVRFGKPLPADTSAADVRETVAALCETSFAERQLSILHRIVTDILEEDPPSFSL